MQSSVPEVTCRGGPPARGISQICHGWPALCLPDSRTDRASGDSAGSAEIAREGARRRETPLAKTLTAAPAGNRSPARSTGWTAYSGASVYRSAPGNAAAPPGRISKKYDQQSTESP